VFEVGKVIHFGAMFTRQLDTDIRDLLTLGFEIPIVSPTTLRKLPEA